ncbi:MAG: zf-HC2 domain-containing protein [Planctomycetales bacterium]|nr:zf-HC2 domain-containing protein [Planctomycetales bacterium]
MQSNLVEYLLGELDPVTQRRVQEHLAHNCEQCLAELRRLDDGVSSLYGMFPQDRTDQVRASEIASNVLCRQPFDDLPVPAVVAQSRPRVWLPVAYACCFAVGFLGVLLVLTSGQPQTETAATSATIAPFPMPRALVALEVSAPGNEMNMVFLYDNTNRELHFFGKRLVDSHSGQSIAITCGRSGGETLVLKKLHIDKDGRCQTIIDLSDLNEIQEFFVQTIPGSISEGATLRDYDNSQIIAHSPFMPRH